MTQRVKLFAEATKTRYEKEVGVEELLEATAKAGDASGLFVGSDLGRRAIKPLGIDCSNIFWYPRRYWVRLTQGAAR